jgi:hypothetical protein
VEVSNGNACNNKLSEFMYSYRTVVHTGKKYLRQQSIDFDVCNLLSSGEVIYKNTGDINKNQNLSLNYVKVLVFMYGVP